MNFLASEVDTGKRFSTLLRSPAHRMECMRIVEDIVDNIDDSAILELTGGTTEDLDTMLDLLIKETYSVMYTGNHSVDFAPRYSDKLSECVEETLRCKNLAYFVTSVLPDFQMSWHHLEWFDLVQKYPRLCINAARNHGKCLGTEVEVLMADGSTKKAGEVQPGDLLMGPDSTPRKVVNVLIEKDANMYRVDQTRGDSYTCNSRHIGTYAFMSTAGITRGEWFVEDIELPVLLELQKLRRMGEVRGIRQRWELPEKKVPVDPYFLGLWLVCGTDERLEIKTDNEYIVKYCEAFAKRNGLICVHSPEGNIHTFTSGKTNTLHFTDKMRALGVFDKRLIPELYLKNSIRIRKKLFAGIADGFSGRRKSEKLRFRISDRELMLQIKYLCNSLALTVRMNEAVQISKLTGKERYRCDAYIFGNTDDIPLKNEIITNKSQKSSCVGTIDGIRIDESSGLTFTNIGEGEYACITLEEGDRRFFLADGTITHNSFAFSNAYPIWKMYRYSKGNGQKFGNRPGRASSNRTYLFSFSLQQAIDLMEILKTTIENNSVLAARLYPEGKEGAWASTNIMCKNGARLTCKGFGSSVRGAHPSCIIIDDPLKDNVLYSQTQRQKSIDYFHSVVMNMLNPDGNIVVVGTPFHADDLYGDLKKKSIQATGNRNAWFVIEYPSIFPDGRVLWPQRFSFDTLMDMRATQGNIVFSRENLCRPITNESSIFPLKVLERSTIGMEKYVLVNNRNDFPLKFNRVVVGCDFAISANVGADYSVFTVWGVDEQKEMWLLHMYRDSGKTFHEQIQVLKGINIRFSPDVMVLEQNTFQMIFVQEGEKQGLPVMGHTTGIDKFSLKDGWPAVAVLFERGKIHIPTGDEHSRNVKDLVFSELGSIAFTDRGLQSVGSHDDIGSSFWLATLGVNKLSSGFRYDFF